jgi:hypothetical protein
MGETSYLSERHYTMRQWMVAPYLMCQKHLLGEHAEHHMFVACINQGRSIEGFIADGLVEPQNLHSRHAELVTEMRLRGLNHFSDLAEIQVVIPRGTVFKREAMIELARRCVECRERMEQALGMRMFKCLPVGGDSVYPIDTAQGPMYKIRFNGQEQDGEWARRSIAVKQLEDIRKTWRKYLKMP